MSRQIRFLKGHGTKNDFVLLPDADGTLLPELPAATVAALCDRRGGIGGDGVIRVVRTESCHDPAAVAARGETDWFMDYRNSDGSPAEMCGNGVRVMARYLVDHEGADPGMPLRIATRAGVKELTLGADGQISVDMGVADLQGETKVVAEGRAFEATHVDMGNPHAVTFVSDLSDAGPLLDAPSFDPDEFPSGANVEFVVRRGAGHVAMRVHERGSGETWSCGTGACAAAVVAARADGHEADGSTYRVDVPGGTLSVTWTHDRHVVLTGPAVLVAEGYWLAGTTTFVRP